MNVATQWYIVPVEGGFGLFRDYYGNLKGTYIERFRLKGQVITFQTATYAARAATHLNKI